MAWETVANIVSDAYVLLGLGSVDIEDPYASTDDNVAQLCRHLTALGKDLARDYQWSQLNKTGSSFFPQTVSAATPPTDFDRFVDGTGWQSATQKPLSPITPQGWTYLQVTGVAGTLHLSVRLKGGKINITPTPTVPTTISYEYQSTWWVHAAGGTAPTKAKPTAKDDVLWFDERLLVEGLRFYFLKAKGFDSAEAENSFNARLRASRGGDSLAGPISLNSTHGPHLICEGNLPDTGYGS